MTDQFVLAASLDSMLASPEGTALHGVGDKLLTYMQARGKAKNGRVSLPMFSEEEEAAALVTEQIVLLKAGMLDRIFAYAETIEQLRKLLMYCSVTLQVAAFDFGMSDEPAKKAERLREVVFEYLIGDDE